ncbi:hypothetical protein M758_UG260400 [Ceratodon purpureus]|nr:hypothetical protein M758_UG260400 [Ceratodon purpureus]
MRAKFLLYLGCVSSSPAASTDQAPRYSQLNQSHLITSNRCFRMGNQFLQALSATTCKRTVPCAIKLYFSEHAAQHTH